MPLSTDDLKTLCTRERDKDIEKWEDTLRSNLEQLLGQGSALRCRAAAGKQLVPMGHGHRFKENQDVHIVEDVDLSRVYRHILNRCTKVRIDGVGDNGRIKVDCELPPSSKVLLIEADPLLEDYARQRSIIEGWLYSGKSDRQAQLLRQLLAAPGTDTQPRSEKQAEEVYAAARDGDGLLLVQGPPGCGKTWLCADVINCALRDGLSVGVFTFTNRACDQLLKTLAQKHGDVAGSVYRHGNEGSWEKNLRAYGIGHKQLRAIPGSAIGTTIYQATKWVSRFVNGGKAPPRFDLVIIDEASQVTLPMICAPMACAESIILVGDQKQLAPVLQSKPEKESETELYQSAFEFLAQRTPYVFLDKTYRMRPEVCEIPSRAFYGDNLLSDITARIEPWNNLPGMPVLDFSPGQQLIIVPRQGRDPYSSPEEAGAIWKIIQMWQQHAGSLFDREQMSDHLRYLVSCFYRSQVNLVQQKLDDTTQALGEGRVHVDTVERNQGQTCVISFLSIAGDGAAAKLAGRGYEWLMDPRRLNVAITRARAKSYILACREYVEIACSDLNPSAESRTAWQLLGEDAVEWAERT